MISTGTPVRELAQLRTKKNAIIIIAVSLVQNLLIGTKYTPTFTIIRLRQGILKGEVSLYS
jgi:hypothetical protein